MRGLVFAVVFFVASLSHAEATPWVPIEVRDGYIFVPSKVGGIEGFSYIDSGERHNGINASFVAANDLSLDVSGRRKVHGAYEIERRLVYGGARAEMFGSQLTMNNLTELNLSPNTQLLLGAPFLSKLIFQFDYPNSRMRAFTRDAFDMKKLKNVESKRDVYNGETIVRVRLNDERDVWLLMDTGNQGGIWLERRIAARQGWLDRYPTEEFALSGTNSSGEHESFALPVVKVGPFEVEQARITVPVKGQELPMFERQVATSTHTRQRQRKSRGLLGYDVLRHFVVTMDYADSSVHLALPEDMQAQDIQ